MTINLPGRLLSKEVFVSNRFGAVCQPQPSTLSKLTRVDSCRQEVCTLGLQNSERAEQAEQSVISLECRQRRLHVMHNALSTRSHAHRHAPACTYQIAHPLRHRAKPTAAPPRRRAIAEPLSRRQSRQKCGASQSPFSNETPTTSHCQTAWKTR